MQKVTENACMMATINDEDGRMDQDMPGLKEVPQAPDCGSGSEPMERNELAALPYINPYEDEGVWAILDEGCNSSTHTPGSGVKMLKRNGLS